MWSTNRIYFIYFGGEERRVLSADSLGNEYTQIHLCVKLRRLSLDLLILQSYTYLEIGIFIVGDNF